MFRIRLFARLRDSIGPEALVDVPSPATPDDLRNALANRHPQLQALILRSAFAVNEQFADSQTPLQPSDSLALIPPVSGGSQASERDSHD